MKKVYLIIFSVIVLIILFLLTKSNIILYINWQILLPNPINEKIIYEHDFTDGENFYIWLYDANKYNKALSRQGFKKISEDNIKYLEEKMEKYYDNLDNNEKTLYWNNVSWDDFNFNTLSQYNNYYYYKNKDNNNLLIITNVKNKCLYIFESYY